MLQKKKKAVLSKPPGHAERTVARPHLGRDDLGVEQSPVLAHEHVAAERDREHAQGPHLRDPGRST